MCLRSLFIAGMFLVDSAAASAVTKPLALHNPLSLRATIEYAQTHDDWLVKSQLLESRLQQLSLGAATLRDPTVNIGLLNLPTNGFALNQEPMTQLKIGVSQMFF
ncbi:MAG: hypothetical protein WA981_03155 [Glaciecola sp.]